MGVQGLRKLIDSSGCARQLNAAPPCEVAQQQQQQPQQQTAANAATATTAEPANETHHLVTADHVLVDMNCVIHQSFSRTHADAQATIRTVMQALRHLFGSVVRARRTLVLCFDGPAPVAKLATQRQRRRKVAHLDVANSNNFCDLSITTGSTFMLELEQHVAHFVNTESSNTGLFARTHNVSLSGTSVPGEGEAKIASALSRIAATSAKNENDSVIVVGNDIDLVLTCIAATSFHNIGVLNPQTMQIIDVGSFLARWVTLETTSGAARAMEQHKQDVAAEKKKKKNNNNNKTIVVGPQQPQQGKNGDDTAAEEQQAASSGDAMLGDGLGFVSFTNLPGARIDFVWLFMLNGGDYYDGLGDVALSLWKRYKMLKRERPEYRLVSKTHQLIVSSLRALFQCEQVGFVERRRKRGGGGGEFGDEEDDSDFDDEKPNRNAGLTSGRRGGPDDISPLQKKAAVGLLHASLWSLIGTVSGCCPNFRFRPLDPKHLAEATYVTTATLRATLANLDSQTFVFKVPVRVEAPPEGEEEDEASSKKNARSKKQKKIQHREEYDEDEDEVQNENFDGFEDDESQQQQQRKRYNIHMQPHSLSALAMQPAATTSIHPDDALAPLTPLQTYCALMPRLELLPKPIRALFEKNATLAQKWHAGGGDLLSAMRRVFQLVDMNTLTPAERFLTQFGDPIDCKGGFFRGHPMQGVARKDHNGARKYMVDFFRFSYATGSSNSNNAASQQTVVVPFVASDLVAGAARINEQAKRMQRLSKEQARELAQTTKNQIRNAKTTLKRELKKKKTKKGNIATETINDDDGGFMEVPANSSSSNHDRNVAKAEHHRSQLLKKQSSQQRRLGASTQQRRLYWHDVFSKESKDKVV